MRRGAFLSITIGLSLLLLVITLLLFLFTVDLLVKQTQTRAFEAIARIHETLDATSEPYQEIARRQSAGANEHIIIVDSDFLLLADSFNRASVVSGRYINAEISDAKEQGRATAAARTRSDGTLRVSAAKMVRARSRNLIISVTYSVNQVGRLTTAYLLWAAGVLLILAGLILSIVSYSLKRYRRPIRSLLRNTEDAARGGFSKISVHTNNAELAELVDRFNSLVDHYDFIISSDSQKYSRINTLLSSLQTGILMVDTDNAITLVNPRAEELLGIDRLELFKHEEGGRSQNALVERILTETRIVNEQRSGRELTLTSPNQAILDVSIEAIRSKYQPYEHSGALVIVRDVTEMRRLERLKDQFISNVSHELRTPLTIIGGFAETLRDWQVLRREDREEAIEIIHLESERLKKLVSDLLTLSKIAGEMEGGRQESIDPSAAVEEVLKNLEPLRRERGVEVRTSLPDSPAAIAGVENWFRQIVANLCENAIKYSPAGGVVAVSITALVSAQRDVVELRVEDSGEGIPEAERERVFDRFYQINKSSTSKNAGTGLGLAIVKHMVDELGGTISIEPSSLGGACFVVRLPAGN